MRIRLLLPILIVVAFGGCSTPNEEAPGPNEAHPSDYILKHSAEADSDLDGCTICHGKDFQGTGNPVPGCTDCHASGQPFTVHSSGYTDPAAHGPAAKDNQVLCRGCHGSAPNQFDGGIVADPALLNAPAGTCSAQACHPVAGAHPTNWQGSNEDTDTGYASSHRTVSSGAIQTGCALCHKIDGPGAGPLPDAPSCFSAGFTNADGITSGCHTGGFGTAPHDMPYTAAASHGAAAKADLVACQACHGLPGTVQFASGGAQTGCATAACHPDAGAHPTRWQGSNDITSNYISTHRNAGMQSANCSVCHDYTAGRTAPEPRAPSCFSADFTNGDGITTGCHAAGPSAPHAIPYTDGAVHGPAAKVDLEACQTCHGTPGTIQFNGGTAATGCATATCHPDAAAHPTRWQGSNDNTPSYASTHRNAGATDTACAICHNTAADAPGPRSGAPSCFTADFTNNDGVTTGCHAAGPSAPHGIPYTDPAQHGSEARADLSACQACHGSPGTIQFNGGLASTGCSTAACHPDAGAHPTRWQGTNDNTSSYLSSHRIAGKQNTNCLICHDYTQGRTAPVPSAPSCFSASFTNADGSFSGCHSSGPGAPHAVPFADGGLHGPDAKADLTYCQQCHADPFNGGSGSNPRFNVPLGSLTNGCEDCHAANTAHPLSFWTGAAAESHKTAGKLDTACALCHGINLNGGEGPACSSCHTAGDPLVNSNCTSCHNDPPDGGSRPNRHGSHSVHDGLAKVSGQCLTCHNGSGTNTSVHYDSSGPADVSMLASYAAQNATLRYNSDDTCSGVRCHGGLLTPKWLLETIDVDTECVKCHQRGTSQYSPDSGRHGLHLNEGFDCTECHNASNPAGDPVDGSVEPLYVSHFVGLDTSALEGDPADTIRKFMNYNAGASRPTCSFGRLTRCHDTGEHQSPKRW